MIIVISASALVLPGCDNNRQTSSGPEPSAMAPARSAAPASAPAPIPAAAANPALLSPEKAKERAPETFRVRLDTTKGPMTLEITRAWSPNGADRFYNMAKLGFLQDVAIFRVIDGFMMQTGIHGDPTVSAKWREARIPDDPPAGISNKRGMVSFATAGPDSRTTQFFFSFGDNSFLDGGGFTPFAKVVEGELVLDKIYRGYGESPPKGRGPDQGRVQLEGNAYLKSEFPNLDYIKSARLL